MSVTNALYIFHENRIQNYSDFCYGQIIQAVSDSRNSYQYVGASVFWDAEDILLIDYLEKGKTITGEYYSNLLTRLDEKIREKRPGLQKKKNHLSSGQCTRPQKCFGNGKIKGSALRIVGTSTLFPRFDSL
jgi:hypothetical protein